MYHVSQDARSKASAKAISNALMRTLEALPLADVKIIDLVKIAGVGRATFYRCFDTVDDVIRYICDETYLQCGIALKSQLDLSQDYRLDETFIKPYLLFWEQHTNIVRLIIKTDKIGVFNAAFNHMLKLLMVQFPEIEIPYYNYYVAMRSAISTAVLIEWVKSDMDLTHEQLTNLYLSQNTDDSLLIEQLIQRSHQ
ncbi:MAG: hypothetical protein BGO41_04150 [Clostridiales bacterium 38-18]|nr:MAG: hypothetical protein BGO41_04150 [Clostridiales bacterium 38-18]